MQGEPIAARTNRSVIVLDPSARHALATVRGLGQAGWRPIVAGHEPRYAALAAASRYAVGYEALPSPWRQGVAFESSLRRLVIDSGAAAVVACSDVSIARIRDLTIDVPTLPARDESLDRLLDKSALATICDAAGVRYPASWLWSDMTSVSHGWPLVVKPRRTAVATPERVISQTGASVVHDEHELYAAAKAIQELGLEPLVQARADRRYKVNVSLVRRAGLTSFQIAYQVVREYPPEGGLAAAIETIDAERGIGARALELAARVCDAAGYGGLANVEFYGQADGELCLIEVNPRVWGSIWLPERLKLQPAHRAVSDALGESPGPPVRYKPGSRFHRPSLELKWLFSRSSERGSRMDLLRSIQPWDVVDVFSLTDPLPVLHVGRWAARSGVRALGRALSRFAPR